MRSAIVLLGLFVLCLSFDSIRSDAEYVRRACANPLPYGVVPQGYCAFVWASGLGQPRALDVASNGDVIVLDQGQQRVIALWENSTHPGIQSAVLTRGNGLNHGVKINGKYLYASNPTTVFRWPYTPGHRSDLGASQVVVKNIPCCHHSTRTLEFDDKGFLFVQSGSGSNVDPDPSHSQIHRFDVSTIPNGGIDWNAGEAYAIGLRNEVGVRWDKGQLWGVENGCDDLNRPDLGGDIHNDNPSEEMNLFQKPGAFYGYPYCWSEYKLAINHSKPTGSQWVHPDFMNDGTHSDAWCSNLNNVVPPIYNFGAHTAPLDILFYYGKTFATIPQGDAFVSLHGSWDRQPAAGYRVLHVRYQNGLPVGDVPFLYYQGPGETGNNWKHRPVGLVVAQCGGDTECLLVSSDASGVIIAVIANSP